MKIKQLFESLRKRLNQKNYLYWTIAIFIAAVLAIAKDHTTEGSSHQASTSQNSPDTYIPAGFVLVPIQISNLESVDSILGQFGVVDLYAPAPKPGGKPLRLAAHIKMLRAPLNPSQFAVLAREDEAPQLIGHEGAFFVVVQNPKRLGTEIVNGLAAQRKVQSRITVENSGEIEAN